MINALKNPSFFRPPSRPSSPSPAPMTPQGSQDTVLPLERTSRSHTRLSLTTFKKPSPVANQSPVRPSMLVQDGSYLEMLSLKLSEAVSRALAQPTGPSNAGEQLAGRRPLPAGRGRALGELISSEIKAVQDNPHLLRAVLRSLLRPLSVLISHLSSNLAPLLSSPAFLTPPAPTVQLPNPNPTQLHALAIAAFSAELLETFDDLSLAVDNDVYGEGLKPVREALLSFINRVVNPLIAGIKSELMSALGQLETVPTTYTTRNFPGNKAFHHAMPVLQVVIPIYARALTRYAALSISQTGLASLLISAVWHGMVAIVHRQPAALSPPSSPTHGPDRKSRGSPPSLVTSPMSAQTSVSRFSAMKLLSSRPPSRPSSPPSTPSSTAAADARTLCDLLETLPRPKERETLAKEAVEEAFERLRALIPFLEAINATPRTRLGVDNSTDVEFLHKLEDLTVELPTLVCLPVLLHAYCGASVASVSEMLGLTDADYRAGCLTGFARADECAIPVGRRVLDILKQDSGCPWVIIEWLENELEEEEDT
ncbi:hypothetical protein FISHEDRAFT_53739 [Fistulina hepatica ATCC 64428]|uniref:Uncharacterized protein n=1 Tax=Fistulina hepatica ATCC 64428 TaxID=1128425 RepID=A0A0D7A2Y7_9AGAR|nr:hypothetical protein FISHEDRAFT_53739 [Fistulina hepatica ATCC 64428]